MQRREVVGDARHNEVQLVPDAMRRWRRSRWSGSEVLFAASLSLAGGWIAGMIPELCARLMVIIAGAAAGWWLGAHLVSR